MRPFTFSLIILGLCFASSQAMSADCAAGSGEPREITKACTALLKQDGLSPSQRADALAQRGRAYYDGNRYDRAMDDLNAAIEGGNTDPDTHLARAKTYMFTGRYGDSIADFDEVVRQRPDDATAYRARGSAFYGGGVFSKAIENFDQAIALDPNYAEAYFYRGIAYGDQRDSEKAYADIRRAYELEPKNPIYLGRMRDLGLLEEN